MMLLLAAKNSKQKWTKALFIGFSKGVRYLHVKGTVSLETSEFSDG